MSPSLACEAWSKRRPRARPGVGPNPVRGAGLAPILHNLTGLILYFLLFFGGGSNWKDPFFFFFFFWGGGGCPNLGSSQPSGFPFNKPFSSRKVVGGFSAGFNGSGFRIHPQVAFLFSGGQKTDSQENVHSPGP